MEVVNLYKHIDKRFLKKSDNPTFHLTGISLPSRILVVGASGGGKTNWLANYLLATSSGRGTFSKIQIIVKDKEGDPLYAWLQSKSPSILVTEGLGSLPELSDKNFDGKENSLIVLDDCVLEKDQSRIEEYFVRCRKKNVTIIYLTQSYYRVPKLIRSNLNYLVLLRLSGQKDANLILAEYSLGVDRNRLLEMYELATSERMVPLVISLDAPKEEKFRIGFNKVIEP